MAAKTKVPKGSKRKLTVKRANTYLAKLKGAKSANLAKAEGVTVRAINKRAAQAEEILGPIDVAKERDRLTIKQLPLYENAMDTLLRDANPQATVGWGKGHGLLVDKTEQKQEQEVGPKTRELISKITENVLKAIGGVPGDTAGTGDAS